jgi:hypothetical protein
VTSTTTQDSRSANRTADTNISAGIIITEPLFGQNVSGWVTITQTDTDGSVMYGPFETMERAVAWGRQLINASIEPVYIPAYNRG